MLKKKFVKDKCVTCKQCMIECAVRHSVSKNIAEAFAEKPHMTVCQNCSKPKCMAACEYGAITKYEDGNVIIDTKKCVGCWACVTQCPFGAITKDAELNFAFNCDDCKGFETMACVETCKTGALVYTEKHARYQPV
jgi:carbon-monoxide dehydrogenase iron sulfur subunit